MPLQFVYPPMHAPTWQIPPEQVAMAFGKEQTFPQAPQFWESVVMLISQPLALLPSQFLKLPTQLIPQMPPVQTGDALGAPGQTRPQPPQLLVEFSDVSQPSLGFPLQSPNPGLQEYVQTPLTQVRIVLGLNAQIRPQFPQLFTSVCTKTSQPSAWLLLQST